jgi:hypothetical protein
MDEHKPNFEDPQLRHETHDPVARYLVYFIIAVGILVVAGLLVSWGTLDFFKSHQKYAPPNSALTAHRPVQPPAGIPQLQAHPASDLQRYLKHEREILNTYGWVDRKDGIVRIPIQRAMSILLKNGLPVRNSKTPLGAVQQGEVQQYTVPQGYMPQN